MGKTTMFLMALAVALTVVVALADATPPGLRRSRFLTNKAPPINYNNCNNKSMICMDEESPGKSCCNVCPGKQAGKQNCNRCVDVQENVVHCGSCNSSCAYGETCCHGKCVDLLNDRKNCGECDLKCIKNTGCSFGFCDYAG